MSPDFSLPLMPQSSSAVTGRWHTDSLMDLRRDLGLDHPYGTVAKAKKLGELHRAQMLGHADVRVT
jgi:hypothetical protein